MEKNEINTKFILIPMDRLELNEGQLEGLPANPRDIIERKFELLKKDIQDYPEMLYLRGLMVYPISDKKYIIIGGNMRYRAMTELGYKEAPCIIIPKETPIEKLKAYTVLDNSGFGKWQWDMLANEWNAEELTGWGVDLPIMESEIDPSEFFDELENQDDKEKGMKIVVSIPTDLEDSKDEIKSIIEDALSDYSGIKVK